MNTIAGQKTFSQRSMTFLRQALLNTLILSPALSSAIYLIQNKGPIHAPYLIACIVLLLTALDFIAVIMIEPQRSKFSILTLPALLSTMAVILLFVIAEALNRFAGHFGYSFLTPFVAVTVLLAYAAVIKEKNIPLKCYLSLNSIALMFLGELGPIDKNTMPF
jgi:hypothetical protein